MNSLGVTLVAGTDLSSKSLTEQMNEVEFGVARLQNPREEKFRKRTVWERKRDPSEHAHWRDGAGVCVCNRRAGTYCCAQLCSHLGAADRKAGGTRSAPAHCFGQAVNMGKMRNMASLRKKSTWHQSLTQ